MAEYYITYEKLETLIDQYINESSQKDELIRYKAEILAAITVNYDENDKGSTKSMVDLWENQIAKPSQLLLGRKYVLINEFMLTFLGDAIRSGALFNFIKTIIDKEYVDLYISLSGLITMMLTDLFNAVKELDDFDFCIYMQAVKHQKKNKIFTIEELNEWFPDEKHPICNIHTEKWSCDHLKEKNVCDMVKKKNIQKTLNSLVKKGLLIKEKENSYKFGR